MSIPVVFLTFRILDTREFASYCHFLEAELGPIRGLPGEATTNQKTSLPEKHSVDISVMERGRVSQNIRAIKDHLSC